MIKDILPPQFDNTYRGRRLALWLFIFILIMKLLMSGNSILRGEMVARSADGVPLDSFTLAGAGTVVALFAIWGLAQLMLVFFCILAFFRYRAMVPLLFAFLLLEHLIRKIILTYLPIAPAGASPPGTIVNVVLVSLMITGLILSLWRKDAAP